MKDFSLFNNTDFSNQIDQECRTRGPRKGFELHAQDFSKSSVPPILAEIQAEIEERFHVQTSLYLVFSEIASFQ